MEYDDEDSTSSSSQVPKDDVEESTIFGPQRFSSRMRKYKNQSQQSKDTDTDTSDDDEEEEEEDEEEEEEEEEEDDKGKKEVKAVRMQDVTAQTSNESSTSTPPKKRPKSRRKFFKSLLHSMKKTALSVVTSFFWRHLALWFVLTLVAGGIFKLIVPSMQFIDCFLVISSGMTGTGLTSVDFSTIPTGGTVFVYVTSLVGGTVAESTFPLIIRFIENAKQQRPRKEAIVRERKAVRRLLFLTFGYIFFVQIFCWIPTALWFQFSEEGKEAMRISHTNAWWVALFEVGMAFQNSGFVMIKSGSLIPINKQFVPLIFLAISTMCGNIMFPILLRFLVYLHLHISKWLKNDDQVSVLKLILKSPRQVSTHLFPRSDTYMLLVVTLTVLTFETFLLLATDYDNKLAFGDLSGGYILFNSWFLAVTTRTAGFNSINIAGLSSAGLILILIHMYLAHYPFTIIMRSSNEDVKKKHEKESKFQISKLMLWDMMCVILPWYLITAIEKYNMGDFSFNVLFEVISGYGTVGLSCSYSNASFCAQWSVPSKLIIIWVMIMGRHREMPDTIDAAFHDEISDD